MLIPLSTIQRMQQIQDSIVSVFYKYRNLKLKLIVGAIMKLPRALKPYAYYTEADWDADYVQYCKHTKRLKRTMLNHPKEK